MNSQRAQLFWSSIVAIGVALLGLHSIFLQKSSAHPFIETNDRSPTSSELAKGSNIR